MTVEIVDTKELRRLAQAATPGPWHATKSVETNSWAVWSDTTRLMELRPTKTVDMYQVSNTAAFSAAANPAAISELLDRIEAAEKDVALKERVIDALGSELNAVAKERDALLANVAKMEQQRPFAWIVRGGYPVPLENLEWQLLCGAERPTLSWTNQEMRPLYALPGAKGA